MTVRRHSKAIRPQYEGTHNISQYVIPYTQMLMFTEKKRKQSRKRRQTMRSILEHCKKLGQTSVSILIFNPNSISHFNIRTKHC